MLSLKHFWIVTKNVLAVKNNDRIDFNDAIDKKPGQSQKQTSKALEIHGELKK